MPAESQIERLERIMVDYIQRYGASEMVRDYYREMHQETLDKLRQLIRKDLK